MSGAGWTIVGIDCATQEERMGLARGVLNADGALRLERVTLGTAGESAAASVSQWIAEREHYVIALDAPLGWPKPLASALARHVAGAALGKSADELFRRHTDGVVHKALGKMPPDVGAGKIARTARAALDMLQAVRACSGLPIPLAWRQGEDNGAIEVYPAATLITRGVSGSGYKANNKDGRKARTELLARLTSELDLHADSGVRDVMIEDANQFDAMVCVLAGADFARAACVEPPDPERARKEGFIWFRRSPQRDLFDV
jgi:predicted RNase H-like nuclease